MKRLVLLGAVLMPALTQNAAAEPLHTERSFAFVAHAPMAVVGPLFGADKETLWAPGWNPDFVWPRPAGDRDGMVFTTTQRDKTAVWVNTSFDVPNGRVQYVYVIPQSLVTVITLHLQEQGAQTHVAVEYRRTALNTGANDLVLEMADHDAKAGPEWEKQINGYLAGRAE